jgi:hypothetical protein
MAASTFRLRCLLLALGAGSPAIAIACSSDGVTDIVAPGAGTDAAPAPTPTPTSTSGDPDATPPVDAAPSSITFSYRPSWKGVKSVEVLGGFGLSSDWKQAFVTLTDDGTGTFTGTAPALAAGHYSYLFRATGDEAAAAAKTATYPRFALDPTDAAFVACPTGAPTFTTEAANPCSDLTVPQPARGPTFHVRGVVHSHGAAIPGFLVQIERDEDTSHHMFADRATSGADGTFDLVVAAGTYRIEILHPTFYALNDTQRSDPESYQAVRRSLSSAFTVLTDRQLNAAEIAYDGYAAMQPRGAATLPTTFTFSAPTHGTRARAAIYPARVSVADPIWVAPLGVASSDVFDGGFNTKKADGGLVPDASYLWGTESEYATPDGGVTWTAQSMVYPVRWQ